MLPQIITLCLMFSGFVLAFAKKGESKGVYEPGWAFVAVVIEFALLWWGGFFKVIGL